MPASPPEALSIALFGECMVEMRPGAGNQLNWGYGGDVLNTAVYLARLLGPRADVCFATVLGDDSFSDHLIDTWQAEGVNCSYVGRQQRGNAGLYLVETDANGERSFRYWRNQSPARDFMKPMWADLMREAFRHPWIYLSGITLAILNDEDRTRLIQELDEARNTGATIVFDGNFRSALWPTPDDAANWHEKVWHLTDMALAGAEDERQLFGDHSGEETMRRLKGYGIPEIVLKQGSDSIIVSINGRREHHEVGQVQNPTDTTAAGDSFNAGYLAARLLSLDVHQAIAAGATLAANVIQYPGAIMPHDAMPELFANFDEMEAQS